MQKLNGFMLKGKIITNGLTMKEFAEKMGIDPATLNKKLKGKSEFKRDEIMKAIAILELTPDEVMSIFFYT